MSHVIWPWLGLIFCCRYGYYFILLRSYSSEVSVTYGVCLQTLSSAWLMQCRCQKILIMHDYTGKRQENANAAESTSHQEHILTVVRSVIIKMDHHCPWVNNTVGLGNHKFFMLFCFYVSLASWYAIVLIAAMFVTTTCNRGGMQDFIPPYCANSLHPENIVFIILLCIESFLFGLFTLCMLCDQINSVVTNQTYIDRLKDKNNNSKRRRQGQGWWKRFFTHMREVVGDRP